MSIPSTVAEAQAVMATAAKAFRDADATAQTALAARKTALAQLNSAQDDFDAAVKAVMQTTTPKSSS